MFARWLVEYAVRSGPVLELGVRLNWYRSLPLSCVQLLEGRLDGAPLRDLTLELDGVAVAVADLPAQDERWWHVRDAARVRAVPDALPAGAGHVELVIGTRIPYLVGPDGRAVVIVDRAQAEVAA